MLSKTSTARIIIIFLFLCSRNGIGLSPEVAVKLQTAVSLTKKTLTIAGAREACQLFEDVLSHPSGLATNIHFLTLSLYAATLVHAGRDEDAISICNLALELDPCNVDLIERKGRSLQRLLKYKEARYEFRRAGSLENAAICSCRLGDIEAARSDLETLSSETRNPVQMLLILDALMPQDDSLHQAEFQPLRMLRPTDPLSHWTLSVLNRSHSAAASYSYVDLLPVNINCFDDPLLLYLDDKVHLHRLLRNASFWPISYVLPEERAQVSTEERIWIAKQRNSYGSHGNSLVTTSTIDSLLSNKKGSYLLQSFVDPGLLINERKISLRVYTVCFLDNTVYLYTNGLVKLAWTKYSQSTEATIHMTNSGRDDVPIQEDLVFLRSFLNDSEIDYGGVWAQIREAVRHTFSIYQGIEAGKSIAEYRARLRELGIPKILGFDFMLGACGKVFLIEVNRFPGLESRDESDFSVKQDVVQRAWTLAAKRQQIDIPWKWKDKHMEKVGELEEITL